MIDVTDEVTGLALVAPDGWLSLPGTPASIVLYDGASKARDDVFVTNLIATVSPRAEAVDLDEIVHHATIDWVDAVDTGHVLHVGEWDAPQPDTIGRLIYATYSNGEVSLTLFTAVLVHSAIVTRIDVTVDARNSRDVENLFLDILVSLTLPNASPAALLAPGDIVNYQDAIVDRGGLV
jgi:hypothetical protein